MAAICIDGKPAGSEVVVVHVVVETAVAEVCPAVAVPSALAVANLYRPWISFAELYPRRSRI